MELETFPKLIQDWILTVSRNRWMTCKASFRGVGAFENGKYTSAQVSCPYRQNVKVYNKALMIHLSRQL